MIRSLMMELWLLPRNLAIGIMLGYRKLISPLYGEVCRFYPSFSRYSLEAYQQRGFVVGLMLTVWRLLRCNPFSAGGIDDVTVKQRYKFKIHASGFVRAPDRKA